MAGRMRDPGWDVDPDGMAVPSITFAGKGRVRGHMLDPVGFAAPRLQFAQSAFGTPNGLDAARLSEIGG